jgi:glycosyltransferase involved in cell wall biosynthesis
MHEQRLLVGIYYHPEVFPPTLNALEELSDCFNTIEVICRPHIEGAWKYPNNVSVIPSGRQMSSSEQEESSTFKKILFFLHFTYHFCKAGIKKKPAAFLLYDPHALLAYYIVRPFFFFKHILWYHNHDVAEIERMRKYSIGWFACKAEKRIFKKVDIFTLPTTERLCFFPINMLKGKYFVIPNYPSLNFYRRFYETPKSTDEIRIIFQGRIDEGHGLEDIIAILKGKFQNKSLHLILKGYCSSGYKRALLKMADKINVSDQVSFYGFTPYEEVPKLAASCHMGIAIFTKQDVMNTTLGTASNKIYEYAASGLPVLYYRNSSVKNSLKDQEWAVATDLKEASLKDSIGYIISHYEILSKKAREAFENAFNFENSFEPAKMYLKSIILQK